MFDLTNIDLLKYWLIWLKHLYQDQVYKYSIKLNEYRRKQTVLYFYFMPRFIASEVPIILKYDTIWINLFIYYVYLIANRRLLQILAARPLPFGPAWIIFFPILLRIGSMVLKSFVSPPTIKVNVPFWAPVIPNQAKSHFKTKQNTQLCIRTTRNRCIEKM